MNSLNRSMYLFFMFAGKDLADLIILGLSSVPMLHSSTSKSECSIVGFFSTSSNSKRSYKGARPRGMFLSFACSTSISSPSLLSHFSFGFTIYSSKMLISMLKGGSSSSEDSFLRQLLSDIESESEN